MASETQPLLVANVVDDTPILPKNHQIVTVVPSASDDVQTISGRPSERTFNFKVAGVMYSWFYSGLIVAAVGALLDDIRLYYSIDHTTASLIFPTAVFGYVCAAVSVPSVVARLGWRGIATVSPVLYVAAAIVLSIRLPFFVTLLGHLVSGVGYGFADAGFNAWASKQRKPNIVEGYLHSAYALGCIVGPISTLLVTNNHLEWYNFYRGMVILSTLQFFSLSLAFRKETSIQCDEESTKDDGNEHRGTVKVKAKAVWLITLCCIYLFVYEAVECSFTFYLVSFMKRCRGMDQTKAALSSSIFWIGMAVGRVLLGPVTEYFGTRIAVCGYFLIAICTQLAFTTVGNHVASFILLAVIGILIGPMFPSAVIVLGQKLPALESIAAVSITIAVGQVGGAFTPPAIGFMADKFGLEHLQEVALGLLVLLMLIWIVFARSR